MSIGSAASPASVSCQLQACRFSRESFHVRFFFIRTTTFTCAVILLISHTRIQAQNAIDRAW